MGVLSKNVWVAVWVLVGAACGSGLERSGVGEVGSDDDDGEDAREVTATEVAEETAAEVGDDGDAMDGGDAEVEDDGDDAGDGAAEVAETEAEVGEVDDGDGDGEVIDTAPGDPCAGLTGLVEGAPCDDGNPCTSGDRCDGGVCRARAAVICDDKNPCTDDVCVPAEGCVYANNLAGCDDGDACTDGDRCIGGSCRSGGAKCDDGNPCTRDACDVDGDCANVADDSLPCEDASACSGDDFCAGGVCMAGLADGCQRLVAGDACATATCAGDGLTCDVALLNGVLCDDGNACSVGDRCVSGFCQATGAKDCGWDSECAKSHCDRDAGCVIDEAYDAGKTCDDDDDCTLGDTCDGAGTCAPTSDRECEDHNPCTENQCYSWFGCSFSSRSGPCDDGNACTTGDSCEFGQCRGGGLLSCDDGDACTLDSCDPITGCETAATSCDDGNDCTIDRCEPPGGCRHVGREGACEDGLACTSGDVCVGGACVGEVACDDSDPCTVDVCDHEEGCVGDPICDALAGEGCDGATCFGPASRLAVTAVASGPVRVTITNQSLASFRLGGFSVQNADGDEARLGPAEVVIGPGQVLVGARPEDAEPTDADFVVGDDEAAWAPVGATTLLAPGGAIVMTFAP